MKKLLALYAFALVTFMVNAQSCPDDNHPHAIDLGLPSGTKWACCNVGADKPEAYGGYYAWGETEEKNYYYWSTYIHCDGSSSTCHDLGSDIAGTQYDVAHVKWGGSWVMPSLDQIKDLLDNCTSEWTTLNGVNGRRFTGKNGGTFFLPAAGDRWDDGLYGAGGYYWSSSQYPKGSNRAYSFVILSYNAEWASGSRYFGRPVRPVASETNIIYLPESSSNVSTQAIYNVYGIKAADNIKTLPPGIYIVNGKKIVIK